MPSPQPCSPCLENVCSPAGSGGGSGRSEQGPSRNVRVGALGDHAVTQGRARYLGLTTAPGDGEEDGWEKDGGGAGTHGGRLPNWPVQQRGQCDTPQGARVPG